MPIYCSGGKRRCRCQGTEEGQKGCLSPGRATSGSKLERRSAYKLDINALDLFRSSKGECHVAINDCVIRRSQGRISRLEEPQNVTRLDLDGGARRPDHACGKVKMEKQYREGKEVGGNASIDSEKPEDMCTCYMLAPPTSTGLSWILRRYR